MNWPTTRLECIRELGYALVYMRYLHSDVDWGSQLDRVELLCEKLALNQNRNDASWWAEFLSEIRDETENLC